MAELVLDDRGRAPNFVLEKNEVGDYRLRHQPTGLTWTFGPEKPGRDESRRAIHLLVDVVGRPVGKRG